MGHPQHEGEEGVGPGFRVPFLSSGNDAGQPHLVGHLAAGLQKLDEVPEPRRTRAAEMESALATKRARMGTCVDQPAPRSHRLGVTQQEPVIPQGLPTRTSAGANLQRKGLPMQCFQEEHRTQDTSIAGAIPGLPQLYRGVDNYRHTHTQHAILL